MTESREITIDDGTVRRPRKPWTETVHALLRHLRAAELPVPEPLGTDEHFEYVSLVPGLDGDTAWPDGVSVEGTRSLGQLLRRVHDATADWTPPAGATWSVHHSAGAVICHGDPKPANATWVDERAAGLFDWDAARPGDPVDDLAYALLWTVPLNGDPSIPVTGSEAALRRERAAALLDGYGWTGPFNVIERALRRNELAIWEVEWLGAQGHEPDAEWLAQGWPRRWRDGLEALHRAGRQIFPT